MPLSHSNEIEKLAAALAKAQGTMDDAAKDSLNPHFKSSYSDLASVRAAVRMPLSANGLSYVQFPEADGNRVSCETMLMHDSGQWMRGTLTLTATQANAQAVGSAITYCRRYSLMAVLGIAPSEDDDGNEASKRAPSDNNGRATAPKTIDEYRHEPSPFDDEIPFAPPVNEPAVSTKAIGWGREMKGCLSIPDLNAFKKTPEFKTAFDAMHLVDQEYILKILAEMKGKLATADLRMAG